MIYSAHYRRKNNSWQVIISWKDSSGKWHQKSKQGFALKADAKEAESDLIAQIKKAPQPVDKAMADITLLKFCETYLKTRTDIVYITKKHYTNAVKSLGGVAKKPVRTITYLDLQTAVSGWNLKPLTQSQYRDKLRIIFRAAVKPYGLISASPMEDITIARNRKKDERRTLTEDEQKRMTAMATPTNNVDMALNILLYTGLRKGELLALTWNDIDLKDGLIRIGKQFTHTHDGHWNMVEVKSRNGYREIPLPANLLAFLRRCHTTRPMDIHRRLFPAPHSTYRDMQRLLHKVADDLTPHCLRHTYATTLLGNGVDIQTVAALLGDNPQTVIRTYIHYSEQMRKAAADSIQKIFSVNF